MLVGLPVVALGAGVYGNGNKQVSNTFSAHLLLSWQELIHDDPWGTPNFGFLSYSTDRFGIGETLFGGLLKGNPQESH